MLRVLAASFIGLAACADPPSTITGRASVVDGDTLEIQGERIRIWGVDAPESRQLCTRPSGEYRCGQTAANHLDRWIAGRTVSCAQDSRDRYRRMVARCEVAGEDIGGWLVRQGYAVRYPEYAGTAYLPQEIAARRARSGVWAGAFEYPWDWRRERRNGR